VGAIAPGVEGVDAEHLGWAVSDAVRGNEYARMFHPSGEARAFLELAPGVGDDYHGPEVETAVAETTAMLAGDPLMTNAAVQYNRYEVQRELTDVGQPPPPTEAALGTGIIVAVLVTAVVNVLVNRRAARREAIGVPTDVATARERLDEALATLDSWDPAHDRVLEAGTPRTAQEDVADAEQWQQVWRAADAARVLRETTDPADVAGGMVLAQNAVRLGRHLRGPDSSGEVPPARHPCFLNPLHGYRTTPAGLPGDESGVKVPVCGKCSAALARGNVPDTLMVKDGRKVVPYYRRNDVWSVTGFGALRDDVADLVLRGARAGSALPSGSAHR
jgi:hypothetical protein